MTNPRNTLTLRSIDIPSIHKFGIGFDSMLDELMRVSSAQTTSNYPPHNVIKTGDNTVTIEMAVAGFDDGEVSISIENNVLTIQGSQMNSEPVNYEYLHRGLSSRNFEQNFRLAEHVEVKDATIKNGILTVLLEREVPEEKKPRNIAINFTK
jgi:molecular chaperone IbpA